MEYTLDLSAFKNYKIPFRCNTKNLPGVWYDPEPVHDCKERAESILKNPIRNKKYKLKCNESKSKPDEWIWKWDLKKIHGGIVDVIWENFLVAPYDVFVSHASEDKEGFVDELVKELQNQNLNVWYDKNELAIGDDLRQNIIRGIEFSLTGVVVLSPHFFKRSKTWTQEELQRILIHQDEDTKVVLPVTHNISQKELRQENPDLANLLSASSDKGAKNVASEISKVISRIKQKKNVL